MFSYGVMPPLMFGAMIIFMLFGFPVAFSLAAVGLFFGILGIFSGHFDPSFLQALPFRFFGIISNELLLAIPFFTFMGAILERCGLAEDLLEGTGQLFGKVPGGLAYAVILVGAVLGAITGTVAASVIAMGVISLPVMMRYGYDMKLATGVIAASGTITQLIPPSLVLIVLADQLGRSVGDMYLGAIGPSILQVVIFILYIAVLSFVRPQRDAAAAPEARREPMSWTLISRVLWGMMPSIVLIFLVLGTICLGLATPTEAGAMGAVGAMVLAALHRRLTWPLVRQAMASTMRITSMVVFILIGSTCFSLVFQGMDGARWIEHLLTGLPGGAIGFLIFVNVFVFFLAFFLDFFEIAFIIIPLLAPVAVQARHRPRLVRGAALRQHADVVHASAVRLRAVLPARHRAARGEEPRHLSGRDAMGRHADHSRHHRDLLARFGDLLARHDPGHRSVQGGDPDRFTGPVGWRRSEELRPPWQRGPEALADSRLMRGLVPDIHIPVLSGNGWFARPRSKTMATC